MSSRVDIYWSLIATTCSNSSSVNQSGCLCFLTHLLTKGAYLEQILENSQYPVMEALLTSSHPLISLQFVVLINLENFPAQPLYDRYFTVYMLTLAFARFTIWKLSKVWLLACVLSTLVCFWSWKNNISQSAAVESFPMISTFHFLGQIWLGNCSWRNNIQPTPINWVTLVPGCFDPIKRRTQLTENYLLMVLATVWNCCMS